MAESAFERGKRERCVSLAGLTAESIRYWQNCKRSPEELQALSLRLFRAAAQRAWRQSSFYRARYTQAGVQYGDLCTILPRQLPVLTKADVRGHFADIAAVPLHKGADGALRPSPSRALLAHTSGSTGAPCPFLYAPHLLTAMEANFVRLSNVGGSHPVGFGDLPIRSLHVASVGRGYASSLLLTGGLKKYHAQSVVVDAALPLESWPAAIGDFKPNYLSGYPSCVALVAELQRRGELALHPHKVITGGEALAEEEMHRLAALFDADVINYYGCTEALLVGAGASWYSGMYLFDDLNYTEVDERGRLLVTPLHNPVFPLIRYCMNDVLEGFSRGSAGRVLPFTHIDRIAGREEDLLWFRTPGGGMDFLHPLFLDELSAAGLEKYQFVQQDDTHFVLRCVWDGEARANAQSAVCAQVNAMLRRKGLCSVQYRVESVERLLPDPATGKTPLTVRAVR